MPYYAGFDIGLKNLSFCIIDIDLWKDYKENNKISENNGILLWKNIDLISDNHKCEHIFNSGKKKGLSCKNNSKWEINNKYYCGIHKDSNCKEIINNKSTIQDIKLKCFKLLNDIQLFDQVDLIVIENQPKFNQQMKMFSISLETYFLIRLNINNRKNTIIKFSPSKNKLNGAERVSIDTSHINDKYKVRKYLAIKFTEHLLQNSPQFLQNNFLCYKKKDDLADAFLHCIYYINK